MKKNADPRKRNPTKLYYYFDFSLSERKIIGWGIEERLNMEVELTSGFHRLFVSKGQYNKMVSKLTADPK